MRSKQIVKYVFEFLDIAVSCQLLAASFQMSGHIGHVPTIV